MTALRVSIAETLSTVSKAKARSATLWGELRELSTFNKSRFFSYVYIFICIIWMLFTTTFLLRLFNMEILIVIGVIFAIFCVMFFKKTKVKLNVRFIAHEWMSQIRNLPKDEQIGYSYELIKSSFHVVSEVKVANYDQLMKIIDKNDFNASNFVQLVLKTAINLQNRNLLAFEDQDLKNYFNKEAVLFFSHCVSAVILNVSENSGYELLDRIAMESKGTHMPWPVI